MAYVVSVPAVSRALASGDGGILLASANRQDFLVKLTIGRTRGLLYGVARILGDVNAVRRGRTGQRVANRALGRVAGRAIRRMTRGL